MYNQVVSGERLSVIQPLSNARAKLIRALHRKKERMAERAYLAEGERLLDELARSGVEPEFLFGVGERIGWLEENFPTATIYELDGGRSDLFATEHAQGVGAIVPMPDAPSLDEIVRRDGPFLYLDALGDPGNVGTILRTAEWFGLDAVFFGPGTVDAYNPKTVRATMGAIFRVAIIEDIPLTSIAEHGLPLFALDVGGEITLGAESLPRRAAYVIGSEAHGLSTELPAGARTISIEGRGSGESLNAAVAAGILCHELTRVEQRT